MKEFNVFGMTTRTDNFFPIRSKYDALRDIDTYGDESLFMSRKVYRHDTDDDICLRYRYAIESYTNADEGQEKTWYTLYLVPTFSSLSEKKRKSVRECTTDRPDTMDVFDYGCHVVMARECRDGGFDEKVMNNIANVVDFIDRMRGFYLDRFQNRLGSTGWDMLYDFVKDVDFAKAAMDRYLVEN